MRTRMKRAQTPLTMNSQLKNNLETIKKNITRFSSENQKVTLLAVSKKQSEAKIQEAIYYKIINFGENRVQEAEKKFKNKPPSINLHLIGHLQTNKANKAVELFDTIQTIDTLKIAQKVNEASRKRDKHQKIFCQINIGNDPQKKGFSKQGFLEEIEKILSFKNLKLQGLMTILPIGIDKEQTAQLYLEMKKLKTTIDKQHNTQLELSMGMSGDYMEAIKQGSTMVRVGTLLFGERTRQ